MKPSHHPPCVCHGPAVLSVARSVYADVSVGIAASFNEILLLRQHI
jgi:hypothetical protein